MRILTRPVPDANISESEFRRMLQNLDVHIEDEKLGLIVRRMDTMADGLIDPKEFTQALRWHPAMYKKLTGVLFDRPASTC